MIQEWRRRLAAQHREGRRTGVVMGLGAYLAGGLQLSGVLPWPWLLALVFAAAGYIIGYHLGRQHV